MVVAVSAVAVLPVVAALRLMTGPIDLEFLDLGKAHQFDVSGGKMTVRADRVTAEWSALSEPIRLVFTGLHVTDGEVEVAHAPSVALTFEPRSLVRGRFLPTSIAIARPEFSADVDREGGMLRRILTSNDPDTQGGVVQLLIDRLLAEPNHVSLLGQLDTVEVTQARLTIRDLKSGVEWIAPDGKASLRRGASGVVIDAVARLSNGGEPVGVALTAVYARDRSRITAEAKIDGLKPAMLAGLSPDAALLKGVDIALTGRLLIEADGGGAVRTVSVEVTGGNGTIALPGILPAVHQVRSVNARASVDAATHTSRIHHIDVDLGVAKVSIAGDGIKTDIGQTFAGRAELRNIETARLADYWPIDFAKGGRQWALANVSGGMSDVAVEFTLSTPGNDLSRLSVARAVASLTYRDLKIHYMPHMPELEGVSGTARYEGGKLHFDVSGGAAVGLRVVGATVDMSGLEGPGPHYAAIHAPISGPATAAMALLARPKLGLPKDALFDSKRLGGDVTVELQLAFPMINALTVAELDLKANATFTGFSLKQAVGSIDLTDASGRIGYAGSQLTVAGQGKLDGQPVEIAWREMFAARAPYKHRYELKGVLPTPLLAKAGMIAPEPFVAGPVGVALSYQAQANGAAELQGKFDLKAAKASLPMLAWTKEAGLETQLSLGMKFGPGGKLAGADFDARGGGLVAKGHVSFDAGYAIQQLSLQQLVIGLSDLAIDWRRTHDGNEIALHGRALEMSRVRQMLRAREEAAARDPSSAAAGARAKTGVTVQINDVLVHRGTLGSVQGRLSMVGDRMAAADLALSGGKGSALRIVPAGNGRTLAIYVPDLGLLLHTAGWLDGLAGAYLDLQGRFDDAVAGSPMQGELRMGPYRLHKVAPHADVGNMNSTIDGLNRAGDALQQFNGLEAKIGKVGDRIDIKDGRTSGSSIGLTATGSIDLATDYLRLRGAVVPGFALNNLLSNVPLLGPLLTGGKDGGVFAFSYRIEGPLDDLKPDVSMLSAVAPGALRELFNGMGDDYAPAPSRPAEADRAP